MVEYQKRCFLLRPDYLCLGEPSNKRMQSSGGPVSPVTRQKVEWNSLAAWENAWDESVVQFELTHHYVAGCSLPAL